MKISEIFEGLDSRQILDSRGEPTVEIELHTLIGVFRSSFPSGASKGKNEARVIIDKSSSYDGKSVKKALFNIQNILKPKIQNLSISVSHQKDLDSFLCDLDGTDNKSRLGANTLLPLSISFLRAGAVSKNRSLREHVSVLSGYKMAMPIPYFNVLNGGLHSGNKLVFQEVMIAFHDTSFRRNLESATLFTKRLRKVIGEKYGAAATSVGDEGGFAPPIETLEEALDLIISTYEDSGFKNMSIAIDCAASSFFNGKDYDIGDKILTPDEMVEYYVSLLQRYPLLSSIEDPFDENDYDSWIKLMQSTRNRCRIVADDLTVTNEKMVKVAAEKKMCDTLLVKPNQIGTVWETLEAIKLARNNEMQIMVSHRSGETEDTFISDFAVGIGAEFFKAGAPCRGERIGKYNQLLRIEEKMEEE